MDDSNISAIALDLRQRLGLPLTPHPLHALKAVYRERGTIALMYEMQRHVGLPCTIVLGRVRSGLEHPAVSVTRKLPLFGSDAFRNKRIPVYLPVKFLDAASLATLVYAIAHEYAHILLFSTRNPWCDSERATDVCAMMLGYADAVVEGEIHIQDSCTVESREPVIGGLLHRVRETQTTRTIRYGYLSRAERLLLARKIRGMR